MEIISKEYHEYIFRNDVNKYIDKKSVYIDF